jgi:hypothetical protein
MVNDVLNLELEPHGPTWQVLMYSIYFILFYFLFLFLFFTCSTFASALT